MQLGDIKTKIKQLEVDLKEKDEKKRLLELKQVYEGSDSVVSAEDWYKEAKKEKVLFSLPSGIKGLDFIVQGFRPGNLIIISGPTKQGKTAFCQTLTYNFSKVNFHSLWFSFDTPTIELIERFPKGKLPKFYVPRRNEFSEEILKWIEEKVIEGIAKYGIRVVFVDHLESLAGFTRNAPNYAAELQSIARELKAIAMRWDVVIFLNHHIHKIEESSTPSWTHLKNSSGPAQESDMTIMVWRDKLKADYGEAVYANTGNVSVQLNRRGRTGTVKVVWSENLFIEGKKETYARSF